jgi:hypothetical protein
MKEIKGERLSVWGVARCRKPREKDKGMYVATVIETTSDRSREVKGHLKL